jgi:nicotinamidase/pyrazinamidase
MTQINKNTDALLIIDPQADFCEGGALAVPGGLDIMPTIDIVAKLFQHVVISQDWHPANHKSFASQHGVAPFSMVELAYGAQVAWPDHCVQGSPGAELLVNPVNAGMIVRKGMNPEIDSYSAFFENDQVTSTGLSGYLLELGITRVFLAGLARNYCVGFTALDAAALGYEVYLLEDAVASIPDGSDEGMTEKLLGAGVQLISSLPLRQVAYGEALAEGVAQRISGNA